MNGLRPSTELAIETRSLTKRFGVHAAVDQIDLAVPRGAVFGFLGPNGSGKTTTIRMMLGLAAATSGEITVLGQSMPESVAAVLPRVGALVEGPAFYPFLSGTANLRRLDSADRHARGNSRIARVEHALDRVGLTHAAGKKVRAYSLGMKQRLGIANALLSPRDLLVLDEPTNGLDPQGTREVRSLVRSLAADGTTVFVSSHLLAEIEQICTHAAVMSAGRLVAQGTLTELRQGGQTRVRVHTPDVATALGVLASLGLVTDSFIPAPRVGGDGGVTSEATVSATLGERILLPEAIVAALVIGGVRVRGFSIDSASLEDRFVELTGEGFDIAS
ncbi:ABC transporter ATP-binding protein [Leifsonia kafniensis]|uniref:ABC transporter ATP-binding protein n=1 Tax=Leifsonia kafniensis TaxID=475957 RepID=A0ABP7K2C5_9MICO